jgi:hypothetical protein
MPECRTKAALVVVSTRIDFLINGLARNSQGRLQLLEGGIDRGSDGADDQSHEAHDGGEQKLARVLSVGVVVKQLVDSSRGQSVFQERLSHDSKRGILDKPLNNVGKDHDRLLASKSLTPLSARIYQRI